MRLLHTMSRDSKGSERRGFLSHTYKNDGAGILVIIITKSHDTIFSELYKYNIKVVPRKLNGRKARTYKTERIIMIHLMVRRRDRQIFR